MYNYNACASIHSLPYCHHHSVWVENMYKLFLFSKLKGRNFHIILLLKLFVLNNIHTMLLKGADIRHTNSYLVFKSCVKYCTDSSPLLIIISLYFSNFKNIYLLNIWSVDQKRAKTNPRKIKKLVCNLKNFFQIFKKKKKKRIKLIFVMGNKMKCEFCAVFVHFKQNN